MGNVMLEILDIFFFCMSSDVPAFKVLVLQVTLNLELM